MIANMHATSILFAEASAGFSIPWRVALPLFLAAASLYCLLPKPRNRFVFIGGAAGIAAVVLAGIWLMRAGGAPIPEQVLFYAFSGLAIAGAGLMVTQRNPARAAISFAMVVINVCGLFLLQGAPFLMAATIVVYAGAIIVTFLFVLMLAQQSGFSDADARTREPLLASFSGFALLGGTLLMVDHAFPDSRSLDALLARIERAAEDKDEFRALVEDKRTLIGALHREESLHKGSAGIQKFANAVVDLEASLNAPNQAQTKKELSDLAIVGREMLAENSAAPLPAANVAGLGKLLFTDHLLAVELGGTLLLVATIGAIAITGGRVGRKA
jgi:NADH-quinone oxidoreductase subunit J